MDYIVILLVAAVTVGLCFLADKLFQKIFRGKQQHRSGLAVRAPKRNGSIGMILIFLGAAAIVSGVGQNTALLVGGIVVALTGLGLAAYYLSFGIFYDEDSFLSSSLFKKSVSYRFGDIRSQQLYVLTGGSTVIELTMNDGKTVSVQSTMAGAYPFLDAAFAGWCRQTGRAPEDCPFHDPANSCWFPKTEET